MSRYFASASEFTAIASMLPLNIFLNFSSLCRMASSARLRSVTSRIARVTAPPGWPSTGLRLISTGNSVPSLRKDGTEFPVEISLSPVEGHPGGAVTRAIRDVTERKRAEEAIRQSEEKFRKIFNGSIDAIAVNSLADAKYLDINEGYLKLIGYSREEVLGRTPKELNIWANHAERVTASKELRTKGFIHNFEGEFVTKDGPRRSGLFSAVVVDLPEQPCVISFVRDITERRQA